MNTDRMRKFSRRDFIYRFLQHINLEAEVDNFDKIHETVKKEVVFKGTNLWILIFAIIVASVGLNMNSTAVIIGAMLISPLMGPINGIGYSIATYDFPLFRKALNNFLFAVGASILASTAYFAISPISTAHSELLARTSPSIYDVLIAFFGGLAGIVALSSKQKGNVIPGVAIATALMPPLCTAGYGLATGQLTYFFGAFYLFTINSVFIAFASLFVSQLLKFPIRSNIDDVHKRKVNSWISFVIALVLIPSIYFGYNLVQKEKFADNALKFINNISVIEGNYLLKYDINSQKKEIVLVYGGTSLSDEQKKQIQRKTKDFALNNASILFQQGLSFDDFMKRNTETDNLKSEVNRLHLALQSKNAIIDSVETKKLMGNDILKEIRAIYPSIKGCLYAQSYLFHDSLHQPIHYDIIVFDTEREEFLRSEKHKIQQWLAMRLHSKYVKVFFENTKK